MYIKNLISMYMSDVSYYLENNYSLKVKTISKDTK